LSFNPRSLKKPGFEGPAFLLATGGCLQSLCETVLMSDWKFYQKVIMFK